MDTTLIFWHWEQNGLDEEAGVVEVMHREGFLGDLNKGLEKMCFRRIEATYLLEVKQSSAGSHKLGYPKGR